jgi:hypothetical protein
MAWGCMLSSIWAWLAQPAAKSAATITIRAHDPVMGILLTIGLPGATLGASP